jgi:hypothetical protein
MRGRCVKETLLYPYLRLATCASVIAFTAAIAVGAPILLYRAIEQAPARSAQDQVSSTSSPRSSQAENKVGGADSLAKEGPLQKPRSEPRIARTSPLPGKQDRERSELASRAENLSNQPPAVAPAPRADSAPAATPETREIATAPAAIPPQNASPAPERVALATVTQHAARESANAKLHPPVVKKTAHRAGAKRRTHTAANSLRRFGEGPRDDPMRAYAAGGMERGIVIHPRSIQDVYYYSLPR